MTTEPDEVGESDTAPASQVDLVDEPEPEPAADPVEPQVTTRAWITYLPYAGYVALALYLLWPLWRDPQAHMLTDNYQDQVFFEWVLTHAANALGNLTDPLFTEKLNAPHGINLMANTSVLALALPLAPLTLTLGAPATFVLITTGALAGTASAWYFVLGRILDHRVAAAIGGLFCGFAPAMISQATGHPNIAGQYVLPFIVLAVLRLREPGSPVRRGLGLAALVVLQAFINEELLFLAALALGIFILAYWAARPREPLPALLPTLKTLGVTTLAAGAVLAYPLYRQFFGRGAYHGLPDFVLAYGADLNSYWAFARRSIVGDAEVTGGLAQGPTEENSFYGWPLLTLLLVVIVWLRREPVVRAVAFTAVTFAAMSLGPVIVAGGESTGIGGPWSLLHRWPLFDSVVPTRLALVVVPLVGCLLALFVAKLDTGPAARWVSLAAVATVLLPLTPTPLPVFDRPYVPPFFTAGSYRAYLKPDGVLLGVPPGWQANLHAMQWQTAADQDFRIFGGYYLAPDRNDPERKATYGPAWPAIWVLVDQVAQSGQPVTVSAHQKEQILRELRHDQVTAIVMAAHHPAATPVRAVVDQIAGPGRLVDGMWVWTL